MGQIQSGQLLLDQIARVLPLGEQDTRVKVHFSNNKYYMVDAATLSRCTVGWLLSEVIRQLHGKFGEAPVHLSYNYKHVVGIRMRNVSEMLDYWLTQYERPMTPIRENDELEILYSDYIQAKRVPRLQDFDILKVIGKGGFSKVLQVRKKDNAMLYAMKVISKSFVIQKGKVEQIMAERRILSRMNHPFIVSLHYAFQTRHYLFLILDFCPGGELFFQLHNRIRLPENVAKFYFAEIVLAIEYLHQNHIVYRDLKPENILLDIDGHVKLTDFGLSKENFTSRSRSFSFCGSPEYMCPEMLAKSGHGMSLDFYSLGALLFEMLTGLPPHYSRNRQQMYHRILNDPVTIPSYVSASAASLLKQLLCKNPKERLGAKGMWEVKQHPYLSDINWDDLLKRKIPPPTSLDPRISHFDPEYTSMRVTWSEGDDGDIGVRSQSLVEGCLEINKKRMSCLVSETYEHQMPAKRISMCPKSEKKTGKIRPAHPKHLDAAVANVSDKNWKTYFELFSGYPFTKEAPKKSKSKVEPKVKKNLTTTVRSNVKNEAKVPKLPSGEVKKTLLIKAACLRGESNDSDISITDSDNSDTEEETTYPALDRHSSGVKWGQRSTSVLSKTPGTAGNEKQRPIKRSHFGNPKYESEEKKVLNPKYSKKIAHELSQYETCHLIKEELSKVNANIIKLNDELNGIVSERKRGIARKVQHLPVQRQPTEKLKISAAFPMYHKRKSPKLQLSSSTNVNKFEGSGNGNSGYNSTRNKEEREVGSWTVDENGKCLGRPPLQSSASLRRSSTKCSEAKKPPVKPGKTQISQKMSSYQSSFIGNASKDLDFTKAAVPYSASLCVTAGTNKTNKFDMMDQMLVVRVETADNEKKTIMNNIIRDKVKESIKKPKKIASTMPSEIKSHKFTGPASSARKVLVNKTPRTARMENAKKKPNPTIKKPSVIGKNGSATPQININVNGNVNIHSHVVLMPTTQCNIQKAGDRRQIIGITKTEDREEVEELNIEEELQKYLTLPKTPGIALIRSKK